MIPSFPKFKELDLSDREEIKPFISSFPPYSDFNFTSMWCWDTKGLIGISHLNNNLVVRFTDYITGKKFFSFLGIGKVDATIATLLTYCKKERLGYTLKLVPHDSAQWIDHSTLRVEEDRDNFDYIYDLRQLESYRGGSFNEKRHHVNHFLKKYPHVTTGILNLADKVTQEKIVRLVKVWEKNKLSEQKDAQVDNELAAIRKLLSGADTFELIASGVFHKEKLIGFFIDEFLTSEYAISHFFKADTKYSGIFAYLMQHEARVLLGFGRTLLNFEQDLGLSGLRRGKLAFRPISFLKKYKVSFT